MAIAIIMENACVYCCQGILNCHMTFAGSVISLARPESWPRIARTIKTLLNGLNACGSTVSSEFV